jgi:hypothetical protein
MYRQALSDAIDAVERGEDPPGLVWNPEDNMPFIDIKWEETPRQAFVIPGQEGRRQQVSNGRPAENTPQRRRVSALVPRVGS